MLDVDAIWNLELSINILCYLNTESTIRNVEIRICFIPQVFNLRDVILSTVNQNLVVDISLVL